MSRKRQRVRIELDSVEINNLFFEEIKAILRAAEEIIATGGRSMLAKDKVKVIDTEQYDSVKWYGEGLFYRETVLDEDLSSSSERKYLSLLKLFFHQ